MMRRRPRIFYHAYSHHRPTGGQKCVYAHVEALVQNCIDAYVYHEVEGFRLTWFDNTAPVIGPSEFVKLFDPVHDYLVLPEDLGAAIARYPGRKIIFNKGIYNGFGALGAHTCIEYPWERDDVLAVFCVSRHNECHLRREFPSVRTFVIPPCIRRDLFHRTCLADKLPIVAAAPKNAYQTATVFHCLNSRMRPNEGQYSWQFVRGLTEAETATLLGRALVFIFLSIDEGLPRMLMEALASGCIVVAYRGGPISELVPVDLLFEYGDHSSIVDLVEHVLVTPPERRAVWHNRVSLADQWLRPYDAEHFLTALLAAWEVLTQGDVGARPRTAPRAEELLKTPGQ